MVFGQFTNLAHLSLAIYRRAYKHAYWSVGRWLPPLGRPHMVSLELTNACNMACPHCHRTNMQRNEGYMSEEVFRRLVDELRRYPYCWLKIVGLGEPGMHPQLDRFMNYLQGSSIKVDFTTSGTLLERYSPEQICAWPIDVVAISIDGFDADSYRRLRPGGDYHKVRSLVAALSDYKRTRHLGRPVVRVRHVIMPSTKPEQLEAYRLDWLAFCDQITFNTFEPRRAVKIPVHPRRCPDQLFFEANVRWDGRVPLCAHQFLVTKQEWLGDLQRNSLQEIWASPRLAEVKIAHRQRRFDRVEFCKSCSYAQARPRIRANSRRYNTTKNFVVNAINRLVRIT